MKKGNILITEETGKRAYYREEDPGNPDMVTLYPVTDPENYATYATSRVDKNSYTYTHGGAMFRAAVDKAYQILAARRALEQA